MIKKFKIFITKESANLIWFLGFFTFILTNIKLEVNYYEYYILIATLISLFISLILNYVAKKITNAILDLKKK